MAARSDLVAWVFDELPPSGARRGGDPSEHAFRRSLESLVREVIQNANDQAVGWPTVVFHLRELQGDALGAYLDAIAWPTLEPHLRAAAQSTGGSSLRDALRALDEQRRIWILNIEDRGTRGLTGSESEGDSHFRALCKDTLYSHKQSEAAGGSYGLGKSVLWSFSGVSTVVFNSVLIDTEDASRSPRLIGRVELPSHAVGRRWYSGSGWFGQRVQVRGRGERAESLWSEGAAERAGRLELRRDAEPPGTTIQIVGFRDPAGEEESLERILSRIEAAAIRSFWPAMISRRRLRVMVQGREAAGGKQERTNAQLIEAVESREARPFIDAYRSRDNAVAALERPGDVVVRTLPFDVPARRDGEPAASGQVDLVVRLASELERNHPLAGHVAMFRGPAMVVRYWDRRGLTIGMRPFHALLLAGEARHPLEPSAEDRAVERFLRSAEPPGHDEWTPTPALKQSYVPGWRKALERLHQRISDELKELLAPRLAQGKKGPDRLQRRFPIGPRGGGTAGESAFRFSRLAANYDGARWRFEGAVEPVEKGRPWSAALTLQELGDDGSPIERLPIDTLELRGLDGAGASVALDRGAATVRASADARELAFRGTSVALHDRVEPPGELSVEVVGKLELERQLRLEELERQLRLEELEERRR